MLDDIQLTNAIRTAITAARQRLLAEQHEPGYWAVELEGNATLESAYIMLWCWLGRGDDPRLKKAGNALIQKQRSEGGWNGYPAGPPELSISVEAYFALKLLGTSPDEPFMRRAREVILDMGGVERTRSCTKVFLALFGQYDWRRVPAIPPELILLPRWSSWNIYTLSAWTRVLLVPLSIIWAHKPRITVPDSARSDELYPESRTPYPVPRTPLFSHLINLVERSPIKPWRRRALQAATAWMIARFEESDGLAALFPAIVLSIIAMRCLGYPDTHPEMVRAAQVLEKLVVEDEQTIRLQPFHSPVWDTAHAVVALHESGVPADHPALVRGASWLLSREVKSAGDWQVHNPHARPSGWYAQFANEHYPDIGTTAMVLLALQRLAEETPWTVDTAGQERVQRIASRLLVPDEQLAGATQRGLAWVLSMQCEDGGWGMFDKRTRRRTLTHMLFGDPDAMRDSSTACITGSVLEMLSGFGYRKASPVVRRAIQFLIREQQSDGAWPGRWGCHSLYSTWRVLRGLRAIREDMKQDDIVRAADWLKSRQSADGGWSESCGSHGESRSQLTGPSTPSQTAWAVMGLCAAGDIESPHVRRGLAYLVQTQQSDGSWEEEVFTGVGVPGMCSLRYRLYRLYFPMMALGGYGRAMNRHVNGYDNQEQ